MTFVGSLASPERKSIIGAALEARRIKTVAIDVDNVLAPLNVEWIRRYNRDWKDSLTIDDLKAWDVDGFVKSECGESIFGYLTDEDLYDNILPYPGSILGVQALRRLGIDVIFVTACVLGGIEQKLRWLVKYGFTQSRDHGRHVGKDVIIASDKWRINADILIDDRASTIETWESTGRVGILYNQPWNQQGKATYRVYDWYGVEQAIDHERLLRSV